MAKVQRELALLASGVAVGFLLLFISSSHVGFRGFGSVSWGYPVAWHYQADLMTGGLSVLGIYLGAVNWAAFYEDLLFWTALSLAVVEGSYHIAIPYINRKQKIHREQRSAVTAQVMDLAETSVTFQQEADD